MSETCKGTPPKEIHKGTLLRNTAFEEGLARAVTENQLVVSDTLASTIQDLRRVNHTNSHVAQEISNDDMINQGCGIVCFAGWLIDDQFE
ncbi:hypothetical protein J6590_103794 [Homalodisca vitripennis]|nr:hypothetical protein J6590_103794 [Homalodisca vitripennis]